MIIIDGQYYDNIGNLLNNDKYKSMILQEKAAVRGDNLLIYGSSELDIDNKDPFRASSVFTGKKDGFQVFTVGTAGYLPLIHAIDYGALGNKLKGQKVVFVLSPQWFSRGGENFNDFAAKYSEEMFFGFMFNNNNDALLKQEIAVRILTLLAAAKKSKNYKAANYDNMKNVILFCNLYTGKSPVSKIESAALSPYFRICYYLLRVKDEVKAFMLLTAHVPKTKYIEPKHESIDWNKLMQAANAQAEQVSTNNPFGMKNDRYNILVKSNHYDINKLHNSQIKTSYQVSPEYGDLRILLETCQENGIKPLIVNIPVNGSFYDFEGFKPGDRQAYYLKIDELVASYGFEIADFSQSEYEKYFLQDASHLGYRGWVYVDEALDRYYNEK